MRSMTMWQSLALLQMELLSFILQIDFAARSTIGGNWEYVDPSFDFRGVYTSNMTGGNRTDINLFKADQRSVYDPYHKMLIWIRLGEPFAEGQITNILRLAISNDTTNWIDYDFIPIHIFTEREIIDAQFDYPEVTISKNYIYLTSSLISGENCEKAYGTIFRISLNDLSNSLDNLDSSIPYYAMLDKNVTGISPVDGMSNTSAFFGGHIKNNSLMRIYDWNEASNTVTNHTVSIAPWNDIHNEEYCGSNPLNSDIWWCKANTSSRIRSSWSYNDSLTFMWNSVTTFDNGRNWQPYIECCNVQD